MKINIKRISGENVVVICDSFSIVTYNKGKTIKNLYNGSEIEKVTVISNDINENISLHDVKQQYLTLIELLDKVDEVHEWMKIDIFESNVEFIKQVNEDIKQYIIKALCQF